jgi:two-component system sensor histidine kinase TctE
MSSIRVRLLKWLIGPILLINLAGASLTWLLAWTPAQLAFDQSLENTTVALAARLRPEAGAVGIDLPRQAEQVLRADEADAMYFAVRTDSGTLIAGDADFPSLRLAGGAYDASMRGEAVRVAVRAVRSGDAVVRIGVAKTLRKRLEVRAAIVRAVLLLEALLALALVGLVWFSVTNGLSPLARMRSNLNAREGKDLTPISDQGVPYELAPVVDAFNDLLDKVQAGAKARQDFLSDMAHQLRTPLAGLQLQLEWLGARHGGDPETGHSLRMMQLSSERMIRQTNQLLALGRAEPSRFQKTRLERVDLADLVAESIQYFVEQAGRKHIDLGYELAPTPIAGDRFLLRDLIDNLVDNAVRYSPERGTVTVSCATDGAHGVLTVQDTGPGIAPDRRELVFQRFLRLDDQATGSGLGLAIVREIAQAHGATVFVGAGADARGAVLRVRFPA